MDAITKTAPVARVKKPKRLSRPQQWAEACTAAVNAIETLIDLRSEYEAWRDNLPENLQQSALGEKLEAVCDLDLDDALSTIQEAEGLDLPRGFGKD